MLTEADKALKETKVLLEESQDREVEILENLGKTLQVNIDSIMESVTESTTISEIVTDIVLCSPMVKSPKRSPLDGPNSIFENFDTITTLQPNEYYRNQTDDGKPKPSQRLKQILKG